MAMLETVKKALRVTAETYDDEISRLISAGLKDLGIAGVDSTLENDPLVTQAVCTYCRVHFGSPDDFDRLKKSYDEQKAQLQVATGYTDWGDG